MWEIRVVVANDQVTGRSVQRSEAEIMAFGLQVSGKTVTKRWSEFNVFEGDYFGPVVNLAARLVAVAAPGQVVVPADATDELKGNGSSRASAPAT